MVRWPASWADQQVDSLICGGIGPGAQMALAEAGIRLYAGCTGDADQRVAELLAGSLAYADNATCDHHDHESGHSCGEHGWRQPHLAATDFPVATVEKTSAITGRGLFSQISDSHASGGTASSKLAQVCPAASTDAQVIPAASHSAQVR